MGKWIIIAGVILIIIGAIIHYAPWLVNWFGRLPGDIHIENERTKIYIPVTSMIIISIVITLLINLFKK